MTDPINPVNQSLPRSLDVNVQVSTPQTEIATDLSIAVCVVKDGPLTHGAGRVRFYSDYESVVNDFSSYSEASKAARDFTSQSPRPAQFAIAQTFNDPQTGFMTTGAAGSLADFQSVTDGDCEITIDGTTIVLEALDFSTATSLYDVASITQTALQKTNNDAFVQYNEGTFTFTSGTSGDDSLVSALANTQHALGTDVSGELYFNGRAGTAVIVPGYTPTGLQSEISLIQEAARAANKHLYGWTFEESYRDSANMLLAAMYLETQTALFFSCTNDPLALDADSIGDIGSMLANLGYKRTCDPIYHDNPQYYPDFALAAKMLAVNYHASDSAITAKFKNLVGIPVVGLTTSQWAVLAGKGYNTFTLTGNSSRVFREGTNVAAGWFIDDQINLDNLAEGLQVAVYNAFLRNGKIPYTPQGQALIEDALTPVCEQYVENGVLAERPITDTRTQSGMRIEPAYRITSASIAQASASDRAERVAPPVTVTVYLAGAIHKIDINVNVYN